MIKLFPNEFLFESKVSEEHQKKIEDYYLNESKKMTDFDKNINRSDVKSDYRSNLIDYKFYTDIIGNYIQEFVLYYSNGRRFNYQVFSFLNLYDEKSYMASHRHPGSELSMIYFLTDGDVTTFYPSNFKFQELSEKIEGFKDWCVDYDVVPEKGKYVIFSSNLAHGVNPSEKNSGRITIASNIILHSV